MANKNGDYAHNQGTSPTSPFNALDFAMEMKKSGINTCTICKVTKVKSKGEVGAVGRISVQPLVQMVDGISQTVDHVSVHNLPYFRLGAGNKGVIMDPKVGDIGVVVFADRDISGVKNAKKVAPPGSGRKFNMADGIYISTCLADAPTCYVRFTDDNKIIASPDNGSTVVTIEKDKITLDASGLKVVVKPTRIDLGQEDAPNAVMTDAGPSTVVFAKV